MANVDLDRDRTTTAGTGSRREAGTASRAKLITSTEARRSFQTTELWISLIMAVALVVAGYADEDGLPVDMAWALAAGVIAFYTLSRGIAKAGSREPQVRDLDMS